MIWFSHWFLTGLCHTCKQSLPPAPPAVPVQPQPIVPPFSWTIPGGMPFTTTPSPHGGSNPLQPFEISTTQVAYPPRHCQETTPIPLSHPPSVSTPSPIPTSCAGLQQLFDTTVNTAHSSPSSSPGPVNSDPSNYWPPLPSAPAITESQVINTIFSSSDFAPSTSNSIQLVTSPASEPAAVYSAVASPDTTSSIYPSYSAYTDTPNTPYPSFTS